MLRSEAPPADPSWLTGPRVAAAVAALGGGAFAAWMFGWAEEVGFHSFDMPDGRMAPVLFIGTSVLTFLAVIRSVEGEPVRWGRECMLFGALNGLVCLWAWVALVFPEQLDRFVALACLSVVSGFLGTFFGLVFCAGYAPVLMLARRARQEPSLDLVSRMVPWCAGWLTAIGAMVGLALIPQTALALMCLLASAMLLAYGLFADRARVAFLDRLAGGSTSQRLSRDAPPETVVPFVAGVGAAPRTLVTDSMADEGPFRSAVTSEAQASLSEDPAHERRALRRRRALCGGLLAIDLGAMGCILTLA